MLILPGDHEVSLGGLGVVVVVTPLIGGPLSTSILSFLFSTLEMLNRGDKPLSVVIVGVQKGQISTDEVRVGSTEMSDEVQVGVDLNVLSKVFASSVRKHGVQPLLDSLQLWMVLRSNLLVGLSRVTISDRGIS